MLGDIFFNLFIMPLELIFEVIFWFLQEHPDFEAEAFNIGGINAPEGRFTCYPHRIRTEGQFVARFRKKGNGIAELPEDLTLPKPGKEETTVVGKAFPTFPDATRRIGSTLIHLDECPDLQGIRILRAGLHLGEVRGKIAIPDHATAVSIYPPEIGTLDIDAENACRYMAGETICADAEGWIMIRYKGLILGWGKGSGGSIRNHYPKGLRNNRLIP